MVARSSTKSTIAKSHSQKNSPTRMPLKASMAKSPTSKESSAKSMHVKAAPVKKTTSRAPFAKAASPKVSKSKGIENLHQLLLDELHDLYSAETQIIDHLPTLVNMSSDQKLKEALKQHLNETKQQVTRLKKIFDILETHPNKQWCKGMEGVLKEGAELLSKAAKGPTKDACIIAAAQKVEHYEICSYGTARAHAKQLRLVEIAHLLEESFEEEVGADKTLSKIAEGSFFTTGINEQANELALSTK